MARRVAEEITILEGGMQSLDVVLKAVSRGYFESSFCSDVNRIHKTARGEPMKTLAAKDSLFEREVERAAASA